MPHLSRLGAIVGLNVGDVFFDDATVRTRVRLRAEIAKGGRAGDVFLLTPWSASSPGSGPGSPLCSSPRRAPL
jgi:hypothetical protein